MKLINYKFWYIKRDDDGFIVEAAIRYYEGEMQDVLEKDIDTGEEKLVNKFVRTAKISDKHLGEKIKKDINNNNSLLYHPEDFGRIKTDNELREFLDNVVKKDSRPQAK